MHHWAGTRRRRCAMISSNTSESIILFSHGFVLGMWPSVWLGLESELAAVKWGRVSFISVTSTGKRLIRRLNDTSYMK